MVTGRALTGIWVLVTVVGCSSGAGGVEPGAPDPSPAQASGARTEARPGSNEQAWENETETGAGTEAEAKTGSRSGGGLGSSDPTPPSAGGSSAGSAAADTQHDSTEKSYPGHGFVVHEWGTDTIVVGSDGSLQRGLHHEEEDLPAFVYDRVKAASASRSAGGSVTTKMETPVTYFYSETPLQAQVRVDFPRGVLTQWYPAVSMFLPPMVAAGAITPGVPAALADPALDLDFPFVGEMCRAKFTALAGGVLDWGTIDVLARDADVTTSLPAAPLDEFSWSHARAVSANPVAVAGGETEKFLFYRGLGDFDLPVHVTSATGGAVTLRNDYAEPLGAVFVINVGAGRGAFTAHPQGVGAGATLAAPVPAVDEAKPLDTYSDELSAAVTSSLDATGLYHDEAQAMVNTWKRQWFRTPGARLLYVIPQSWTESSIPLAISPKPESLLRVMLIRVELITAEQEQLDVQVLQRFETTPAEAQAYFDEFGRFTEPRLRRALALSPSAAGRAYLAQIQRAGANVSGGE